MLSGFWASAMIDGTGLGNPATENDACGCGSFSIALDCVKPRYVILWYIMVVVVSRLVVTVGGGCS